MALATTGGVTTVMVREARNCIYFEGVRPLDSLSRSLLDASGELRLAVIIALIGPLFLSQVTVPEWSIVGV
jgi:hypothetical protein